MRTIDEAEAAALISIDQAIEVVAGVFAELDGGGATAFPVAMGQGSDPVNRFAMKSGRIDAGGVLGLKVGTYWPGNPGRGLESHGSTTLLLDDTTGFPRALVAASYLTALRTAAADAVAVRALANPAAGTVAVVGAGHQAWFDLCAVCKVRPIREARIWSRDAAKAAVMADRARELLGLEVRTGDLATMLRGAPVVLCVTSADSGLVRAEWIAPGAHVSAMGADSPGKQELDLELVTGARLFADVIEQSVRIGEFQAAVRAGRLTADAITPLGAVLNGRLAGRTDAGQITVFDSSGVAVQDLAVADYVLRAADTAAVT